MKTQLIYLDPHDDHASARDKLGWARADRIVLIWPPHGRILTRRLDLVLLLRAARAQGARLGLVTHDPDVRAFAESFRLPVFDSPDELPEAAWKTSTSESKEIQPAPPHALLSRPLRPPPRRVRTRPTSRRRQVQRVLLALLPLVAMLSLAITIVPAAVVEVVPLTTEQTAAFEITLDLGGPASDSAQSIQARRWTETFDGELRQPTSGTVLVPSAPAEGEVVFTNLTDQEQHIPAGTGVRTAQGVRFLTLAGAQLGAGAGSEAQVAVRATQAGDIGNVAAEAIVATEGPQGLAVSVANPNPTTGGGSTSRAGVAPADVDRIQQALTRQLLQEARSAVEANLAEGERIAPDSMRVLRVVSATSEPAIGQPADSLLLRLTIEVEGVTYADAALSAFADAVLREDASEAVETVPGTLHADLTRLLTRTDDGLRYSASADRGIYRSVDSNELRRVLAGARPDEAEARLARRIDLAEPPRIRLWPAWLPRLPLLPIRIDIHWPWDTP
ncbi:MAG TPA: baseplate J/gp47 family protein [Anaerolineales bacterium]|nr:baseplate J/gp47 family protein [Anaerolineales bacterium]